jgi:hypothetical protein
MSDIQKQVESIVAGLEGERPYCRECECDHAFEGVEIGDDCPDCGETLETFSGFDYLSDVLDIEYICNGAREYLGARILVCFGGPNVWVNTRTNTVEGHWWQDSYSAQYKDEIDLDAACQEMWECGA